MNLSHSLLTYTKLLCWNLLFRYVSSLSQQDQNRRSFLKHQAVATAFLSSPVVAWNTDTSKEDSLLFWSGPSWTNSRYRTSTLSENNAPTPTSEILLYPEKMNGYWSIQYKFSGANFPQGKQILSTRTAGAGLGTCLVLPNVGYNPPSPHAMRYSSQTDDVAYNLPRRFESFWPQAKVLSIQTNGGGSVTPKCFVTGEECTATENPNLHLPSSRAMMEFEGPTRRSGRQVQSWDVTLLNSSFDRSEEEFQMQNSYSQFNPTQELQTFYKERLTLEQKNDFLTGKIKVAAFLPRYIQEMDMSNASGEYDDQKAVAVYEYKVFMKSIDESEASSM